MFSGEMYWSKMQLYFDFFNLVYDLKTILSQNTNNARDAPMTSQQRWRHQIRLAWKLAESQNQAEILHFVGIIQLTQLCVSSIHILSSLRKGI